MMINDYISKHVSPVLYSGNVVNFNNSYFSTSSTASTIVTYYCNSNSIDNIVFSLALIYNSDSAGVVDYMIVKTTTISDTHKILSYYNSSQVLLYEVEINTVTGTVDMRIATGQQVMDCITYFYSNAGWVSVGLTIGTMFDHGIGVSVAAACAIGQTFFPSSIEHPGS